jgi:LmbE family N-acetylglucosaminyl deacetylase
MRIICIGAHPDDCEIAFGGCAARFAESGHSVKFLSVTNGSAGHFRHTRDALAKIRRREAQEACRRLAIAEYEILDNPDGELLPSLQARAEIVRQIRRWRADLVLLPRPWDYHPDHRYTSQIVQDAAYLVEVPNVCPDTPALGWNPVFLYLEDTFHLPVPFVPDVAVDIDAAWDRKVDALDAHASQMYEWLPWVDRRPEAVPSGADARRAWLSQSFGCPPAPCTRAALARRYGTRAPQIRHAEAFQVCEYGRRPQAGELDRIFPY